MSLPFPPWPTDTSQTQQPQANLDNIEPDSVIIHPLDFDLDVFFDLPDAENLPGGIVNDDELMSTDLGQSSGNIYAMTDVIVNPFLQEESGFDISFPEMRNDLYKVMLHSSVFPDL
jgi:hypothetical protein